MLVVRSRTKVSLHMQAAKARQAETAAAAADDSDEEESSEEEDSDEEDEKPAAKKAAPAAKKVGCCPHVQSVALKVSDCVLVRANSA